MIKELKSDFKKGIGRIQWFSRIFSERLKIEIAIVKLLYRSDDIDQRKDEILLSIGRRVYDLKSNAEKNILMDRQIAEHLAEIERLEKEILELQEKIAELSRVGT
ncbi:MAG: hypothetical protein ACYC69_14380 [Thermodesulfovibrionales bacterium]